MSQNTFRTRLSSTTAMAKQRMARELAKSRNPKWLQKPPTTPSTARASKSAPHPNEGDVTMDEARKQAAEKAGLRDLDRVKLHAPDVPPHLVIADLKGRYPQAFKSDARRLSAADYEAAKRDYIAGARR